MLTCSSSTARPKATRTAAAILLMLGLPVLVPQSGAALALRKPITIQGAQVSGGPHTDFPVLVSIQNDNDLRSTVNGGDVESTLGHDIQFYDSGGLALDHDLESYDPVSGSITAWVRVPSLPGGSDTLIYIAYGDAAAICATERSRTWEPEFRAVYHLAGDRLDSTAYAQDAVDFGATTTTGQISGGLDFDGVSQYVETSSSDLQTLDAFTISLWFQADSTTYAHHMLWQGQAALFGANESAADGNGWGNLATLDQELHISLGDINGGNQNDRVSFFLGTADADDDPAVLSLGAAFSDTAGWHHVAVTVENVSTAPQARLYLDGAQVATDLVGNDPLSMPRNNWDTALRFGAPGPATRLFDGRLDEVRVSTRVRDLNWIQTEYANQSSPGTFYTVGAEDTSNPYAGTGCTRTPVAGQDGPLTVSAAGTVLNRYTTLASDVAAGSAVIPVTDITQLDPIVADDMVLIIQMQGATINAGGPGSLADSPRYGNVLGLGGAGKYELATYRTRSGNNLRVWCGLKNSYTASGNVQIVRVPQYTTLTIDPGASVVAPAWGGTSGGVVALRANLMIINGLVDASARGFRGGVGTTGGQTFGFTGYVETSDTGGGEKGESIAGPASALPGNPYGRGAPANGGGGGDGHNSGGGGGAGASSGVRWTGFGVPDRGPGNAYDPAWELEAAGFSTSSSAGGGRGGHSYSNYDRDALLVAPGDTLWAEDDRRAVGGRGGHPLGPHTKSRLFLGGGGGAGQTDDDPTPSNSSGGAGGGIVMLLGEVVRSTTTPNCSISQGCVRTHGEDGSTVALGTNNDGSGGGGGGGTVVVRAAEIRDLALEARGGLGGSQAALPCNSSPSDCRVHGPGAGGGGGFISIFAPSISGVTQSTAGGANGTTLAEPLTEFPPNGATQGAAGDSGGSAECITRACFVSVATRVRLISFEAAGVAEGVELRWETASEMDNLGFELHRSESPEGPWTQVGDLIPGLGSSPEGKVYTYRDGPLLAGVRYFYDLVDVETTGKRRHHGPVSAVAASLDAGGEGDATDPDGSGDVGPDVGSETGDAPGRVAYGSPTSTALRVRSWGRRGARIELVTGGFWARPRQDGTVRLEIPGFDVSGEPGLPELPVRRTWIEALAGRRVRIARVRVSEVEAIDGLRPVDAGAPELVVARDGTVRAGRRAVRRRASRRLNPPRAARILETAFQGEVKKALLELAPLRWDADSGQLLRARRMVVDVVFAGWARSERSLGGARGRARPHWSRRRPLRDRDAVAFLHTARAGLHAVSFEEVARGSRRPVRSARVRLARRQEDVPFFVEPDPDLFGPGSRLFFLSTGPEVNPHAREAVYALSLGEGGTPMAQRSVAPTGPAVHGGLARRSFEQNVYYQPGLIDAPDRWLWSFVIAPEPQNVPFDLEAVVEGPGRLTLRLMGATDTFESPDHHVWISVNGRFVAEEWWDGKLPRSIGAQIPSGTLREGANSLEILDMGDTGASVSAVFLDRFEVAYPRQLTAAGGVLDVGFDAGGTAVVTGVGPGSRLLDLTDPQAPVVLQGARWQGSGLALCVEPGQQVLVVDPDAVQAPRVRRTRSPSLRQSRGAAYLAIGPRELLEAARPLLQWRREQGLSVLEVPLEDVVDQFGDGERHPEAIRDFVSFAYHELPTPPRYVLLLGDSSYDPKGYRGSTEADALPAFLVRTPYMWTLSDPAVAAVNGDDPIPDLAIGRLPARDAEEARLLALKVVERETSGYGFDGGPAVLVADDADGAGSFPEDAEEIAQTLLAGRETRILRLDRLGPQTRAAIRTAFDEGPGLVSYLGHGGIAVWASENVFNNWDIPALMAQPQQPLLLAMNCLNGYLIDPQIDSLAEALVKADGRGAAAAFAPSSLSLHSSARIYHDAVVEELLWGGHPRLGDALLRAQAVYAARGGQTDLLSTYLLIGDPASTLP